MCDFCQNKEEHNSAYHKMWIENDPVYGISLVVAKTDTSCPQYSECCAKDVKIATHFPISFCPMCGEKLR